MELILEPPEYMEPVQKWEEWLAELRTLPQDLENVAREIAEAERWIPQRIEMEEERQDRKAA
jgi:hypothetical protein